MIGYAYIDYDLIIHYRLKEYIEEDNPSFFATNAHLILKNFKFDTSDPSNMKNMVYQAIDLGVNKESLTAFMLSIGLTPISETPKVAVNRTHRPDVLPDRVNKTKSNSGD